MFLGAALIVGAVLRGFPQRMPMSRHPTGKRPSGYLLRADPRM